LSCASTNIIVNSKAKDINFEKIKTSSISIYCAESVIQQNIGFSLASEVTPASVVDDCISSFRINLPRISTTKGDLQLPGTYSGKLSLKFKEEMNLFLSKHKSHYVFIVANILAETNTKYNAPSGGIAGTYEADNKHNIGFQLWDVQNKSIVLDYDVQQKGHSSIRSAIDQATSFINNNGVFNK
jgi:hypothetical protein